MIEIIASESDNILTLSAHGTVTDEDYTKVLIPALELKLRTHHKLRLLYHLGEDFKNYTPMAVWDDAKIGMLYWASFEKIAIVSNVPWVIHAVAFFGRLVPCPVKTFTNEKFAEARDWLGKA